MNKMMKPMDRESFEALVRSHQAQLFRYLRYLGADDMTAEDLVQDTFLQVFKRGFAPPDENLEQCAAWLRGVGRNLFLMHCRKQRSNPVRIDSEALERAESFWNTEFLRESDGFDAILALRECMKKLSDKDTAVLCQRYAKEKSRAEMAAAFSMTENGVKSLLQRIRHGLAECIRRHLKLEASHE